MTARDRGKCVCAIYPIPPVPYPPLTRSPFPNGEGCDTRIPLFSTQRLSQGGRQRGGGFAAQKGSQPRLAAFGSPFQGKGLAWSIPPSYGRRCPEGAEVGWGKRYEREGDCLKYAIIREYPSAAHAVPLPLAGKAKSAAASQRIINNIYGTMSEGLPIRGFPFGTFQAWPIFLRMAKISRFA